MVKKDQTYSMNSRCLAVVTTLQDQTRPATDYFTHMQNLLSFDFVLSQFYTFNILKFFNIITSLILGVLYFKMKNITVAFHIVARKDCGSLMPVMQKLHSSMILVSVGSVVNICHKYMQLALLSHCCCYFDIVVFKLLLLSIIAI